MRVAGGICTGVGFKHRLDGNTAGVLAALAASHPVGHDGQTPQALEDSVVVGLPIAVAVLIVVTLAADIGKACNLKPWTDIHSESAPNTGTLAGVFAGPILAGKVEIIRDGLVISDNCHSGLVMISTVAVHGLASRSACKAERVTE